MTEHPPDDLDGEDADVDDDTELAEPPDGEEGRMTPESPDDET